MNRQQEYWELIRELDQAPSALDGTALRAKARAKRRRMGKRWGISLGSAAGVCAAFVLAVNAMPTFALACANVPVLRELAAAVAFSPSLSAAVEHDYVQYIGQSQTFEDTTLTLEYVIADQQQMVVFYRTDGGWPATTGITDPLQIEPLAGGFVELGAEDVLVYSAYGSKILSLQPSYARPVLAVGGTRFAVYNRAGNELTVCSRTRTLYSQNFDSGILLCAMSNNNSLAVVTESGRYAAQVRIYDPSMRQTYSWEMTQSDGTPIAVDFAPDSRKFAAGMLAAREGQLSCSVYFMNTDADTEGPVYTAQQGSMLLRLDWQSESRVIAVFDTYIAVLDPRTGTETARYDFGGATLQSAAPGRRQTALLLNVRGGNSLVTLDENLAAMAEIPARQAFGVSATDTDIYLLCPNAVECFGYDGVQKWVQSSLDARPLAVLDAAQTLVFTGSRASVLEAPN